MTSTDDQRRKELESRIGSDIAFFHGELPEPYAVAWRGYLAALLEWSVIDIATYDALVELAPLSDDEPVVSILRGRDS